MKQSSFSSHHSQLSSVKALFFFLVKGQKGLGDGRNLSPSGYREEKELPKQEGQGRDRMVTEHGMWRQEVGVVCQPLQQSMLCQNSPVAPVLYRAWHIALLRVGREGGGHRE